MNKYESNKRNYPNEHEQAKREYARQRGIRGRIEITGEYTAWMANRIAELRSGTSVGMSFTNYHAPPAMPAPAPMPAPFVQMQAPPAPRARVGGGGVGAFVLFALILVVALWIWNTTMAAQPATTESEKAGEEAIPTPVAAEKAAAELVETPSPCQLYATAIVAATDGASERLARASWKRELIEGENKNMAFLSERERELYANLRESDADILALSEHGDILADYCVRLGMESISK